MCFFFIFLIVYQYLAPVRSSAKKMLFISNEGNGKMQNEKHSRNEDSPLPHICFHGDHRYVYIGMQSPGKINETLRVKGIAGRVYLSNITVTQFSISRQPISLMNQ